MLNKKTRKTVKRMGANSTCRRLRPITFGKTNIIEQWKNLKGSDPFKDTDKDRVIDFVDCNPFNKRQQGVGEFLMEKARTAVARKVPIYKEYREYEEEKESKEPERLKVEAERIEAKKRLVVVKRQTAEEKKKLRKARAGAYLPAAGKVGGYGGGGLYADLYEGRVTVKKKKKTKKRRKRKKK